MANHMWVCPTKNQDEFYNIRKLMPLLVKEFPELNFHYGDVEHDDLQNLQHYINVYNKKIDSLFIMGCYNDCYLLDKHNKSEVVDGLDELGMVELSDMLIDYMENGLDPERCIEIRHTPHFDEVNAVCRWMRWYFGAVVFDEGIHPEFIQPIKDKDKPENWYIKYKFTLPDQNIIKKFKDWFKS